MRYDDCSECGSSMVRMYSKEYVDKEYPVSSPKDFVNMRMQIDMKRYFTCEKCGYTKRLNDTEFAKYVLKAKGLKK